MRLHIIAVVNLDEAWSVTSVIVMVIVQNVITE